MFVVQAPNQQHKKKAHDDPEHNMTALWQLKWRPKYLWKLQVLIYVLCSIYFKLNLSSVEEQTADFINKAVWSWK
jgi:hypothetical protein